MASCPYCDEWFVEQKELMNHIQEVHPEKVSNSNELLEKAGKILGGYLKENDNTAIEILKMHLRHGKDIEELVKLYRRTKDLLNT